MRISRIVIKKFRSIEITDVWISPINSIVGQNNSGKSCLLRALNAFFNFESEKPAFESGIHSYAAGTVAKIELHFTDVTGIGIPPKYISNHEIKAEVSYRLNNQGCTRTIRYRSGASWVQDEQCLSEIKKHVEFILIPPNRDANALAYVGDNVLQLLVEEKMKEATEARDNYTSRFKKAVQYLESNALKKIAADAKKEFPVNRPFDIRIGYEKEVSYQNFLSDIGISIDEAGLNHPLIECGSGIQSLTIIALYNLLGKARDENIVIGLEEPETNLHPQAQKELIDYFKNLVTQGNILQFFFTTHSSQIIDQVDHTEVILFKKIRNETRGFVSEVRRLPEDFFEKYELNEFMYYQFHRYRNSDFFFSSYIVVTESKNEVEVIKKIGESSGFDYEVNGLSYLNLEGVQKAKYAVHLLNELGIPYLLIIDKDFFVDYLNDRFDSSLDAQGLPQYKSNFKDIELVKVLVPESQTRDDLLNAMNTNHTEVLNILEPYEIVCMRYSLDIDLIAIERARHKYYQLLTIPAADRNIGSLTSRRSGIKKIGRILEAFDSLSSQNWPYSYSRIKKILKLVTKDLKNA